MTSLIDLIHLAHLTTASPTQQGPDPDDVVAGWGAFALFGLLILAVALIGFFLVRSLKNVDRSAQEGRYDPSTPRRGARSATRDGSADPVPDERA